MSQVIQDDGRVIPVTFIHCPQNTVVQIKTKEKDGYPALVLGFDAYKNPSKNKRFKVIKEFREEDTEKYKKDQILTLKDTGEMEKVTICSVSKGKGYQGVVKRYKFSRGPETHGSHHHREPGSIGMCAKPGRVLKGKRMPGHMGVKQVTLKGREVVKTVPEKDLIAIKGPVPGANNSYIFIQF